MEKLRSFLLKDSTFILLMILLCAGVMASTNLFVTDKVGAMGPVVMIEMLNTALKSNDWTVLISLSGGFLIARVLEGPLVGILDIGGSVMAGVGFGVFGLIASLELGQLILTSYSFALAAGAIIGGVMGTVIMLIRKFLPQGVAAGGTDIMMGVGHQMGVWLPPLVLIAALEFSIPVGLAAAVGGFVFVMRGKGMLGGVIVGIFLVSLFL